MFLSLSISKDHYCVQKWFDRSTKAFWACPHKANWKWFQPELPYDTCRTDANLVNADHILVE